MQQLFAQNFQPAPNKVQSRVREKLSTDDSENIQFPGTLQMSRDQHCCMAAGRILDFIRGSVTCETEQEVLDALGVLKTQFEIVCVKNMYHSAAQDLVGGYRDIKVFIVVPLSSETIRAQMVCEVQLLLRSFLDIKKRMHLLYTIKRGDYTDASVEVFKEKTPLGYVIFNLLVAFFERLCCCALVRCLCVRYTDIYDEGWDMNLEAMNTNVHLAGHAPGVKRKSLIFFFGVSR